MKSLQHPPVVYTELPKLISEQQRASLVAEYQNNATVVESSILDLFSFGERRCEKD